MDIAKLRTLVNDRFEDELRGLTREHDEAERHRLATHGPIDGPKFWSSRSFPLLPATWPSDGSGRVVFYGYAYCIRRSDRELVTAPWGRAVVQVDDPEFTLELLTDNLEELGSQGFQPASAEDAALFYRRDELETALCECTLTPGVPLPDDVFAYYSMVARNNGVIARKLAELQPGFFGRLDLSW